jgi:hypothetical protein
MGEIVFLQSGQPAARKRWKEYLSERPFPPGQLAETAKLLGSKAVVWNGGMGPAACARYLSTECSTRDAAVERLLGVHGSDGLTREIAGLIVHAMWEGRVLCARPRKTAPPASTASAAASVPVEPASIAVAAPAAASNAAPALAPAAVHGAAKRTADVAFTPVPDQDLADADGAVGTAAEAQGGLSQSNVACDSDGAASTAQGGGSASDIWEVCKNCVKLEATAAWKYTAHFAVQAVLPKVGSVRTLDDLCLRLMCKQCYQSLEKSVHDQTERWCQLVVRYDCIGRPLAILVRRRKKRAKVLAETRGNATCGCAEV